MDTPKTVLKRASTPTWLGVLACMVVASTVGRTSGFGIFLGIGLVAVAGAGYLRRITHAILTPRTLAWLMATGILSVLVATARSSGEQQNEVVAAREGDARKEREAEAVATEPRQAEVQALTTHCGNKPPTISSWDGKLLGAESYLEQGAHDPDSIEVENCTEPILSRKSCWITACDVRGRNAFGALVFSRVTFSVGRDGILGAENVSR